MFAGQIIYFAKNSYLEFDSFAAGIYIMLWKWPLGKKLKMKIFWDKLMKNRVILHK